MATGFKLPIGVNQSGGMATVDGDDNDRKIIKTALTDDENENAFQQNVGLGDEIVFDFNDPRTRARIGRRIREVFEVFEAEERFKLLENTISWDTISDTQELVLKFKYLNLESDKETEFEDKFGASSFGG